MEERSVTRASEVFCITQPTMSKVLRRLRSPLGDQLFDNTRQGLAPKPRTKELYDPVSNALSLLAANIFEPEFVPSQASFEIRIQVPDVFSMSLIPSLYACLLKRAPGSSSPNSSYMQGPSQKYSGPPAHYI